MPDYANLRRNMIDTQLRTNKVTDERVLAAMAQVPRELFVPEAREPLAYIDEDISLGNDRWLMEPMIFARMVQAARVGPSDVVLDIACGTGYSSAVLGMLAATVVALESNVEHVAAATANMQELGLGNVIVIEGDITLGCPDEAPFDIVFINGAVEQLPRDIAGQLAVGGRICCVERDGAGPGKACLSTNSDGIVSGRPLFDANTPLLRAFEREKGFTF